MLVCFIASHQPEGERPANFLNQNLTAYRSAVFKMKQYFKKLMSDGGENGGGDELPKASDVPMDAVAAAADDAPKADDAEDADIPATQDAAGTAEAE